MALLAAGQVLASAILDPLLERAISAAAKEFKLIRGVNEEVDKLALTLAVIQRVLDDAEERQAGEPAVRDWLRQLKQVFLDADDLLDRYATDAALQLQASTGTDRRKEVRDMLFRCFACVNRTMTGRAAAHQICEINQRLDFLVDMKNKFGLKVLAEGKGNSRLEHTRRPQTSSILADVTCVIGREGEKQTIVEMLLSPAYNGPAESSGNNSSFSVLPLVGMGGMGKTTLARLVFNDDMVKKHFQLMMWVCVSDVFDPTRLTKEMSDDTAASTSWESMQQRLRQKVEGRTLLLVLDDVWEASRSQWENLFEPLKFASKGSRVLVTSRSRNAVDISQGRMPPIILKGLPEEDLWLVLKRCAFAGCSSEEEYAHLEKIGRQIANRLKGLPLAAKTIGCLLSAKLDLNHWRRVWKSEMWELQQDEEDGILPALGLSYQYLPGHLKQCFAYCSLFPKDHGFDKTQMAQLWGAECFGGVRRRGRMEDISSECFDNLLQRSFFEPSPNLYGHYAIHDLTHDLAEYVSKDDCFRWEGGQRSAAKIGDTVRHMSVLVTKFDQANLNELCRHEKLRTLLFLSSCKFDGSTHALEELFMKLKRLRVLGLSGCWIEELPSSIGDLKHLRYIDLTNNDRLDHLPESLCNLYNLQVLKLLHCGSLRALPTRMSELINLRHLQADNELFFGMDGLARLTGLEEVGLKGRQVRELGGLSMLRELRISSLEEVRTTEEAIQAGLDSKESLQELMMGWGHCQWGITMWSGGRRDATTSMINHEAEEEVLQALRPVDSIRQLKIGGYGGVKSPGWMTDPTTWACFCLESVQLGWCPKWEVLPALGQLRLLRYLTIEEMPRVRQVDLRFFSSLEELYIRNLLEWEEWWGGGALPPPPPQQNPSSLDDNGLFFFPRLRQLEVCHCPKLRQLPPLPPTLKGLVLEGVGLTCPPQLQHLTSLSQLSLHGCATVTASLFGSLARHRHHHHLTETLTHLRIQECGYDYHRQQPHTTASAASSSSVLPQPLGPLLPPNPPTENVDVAAGGLLGALTSLRELIISKSPNLLRKWGADGLPSSLLELEIHGDDDLDDRTLSRCLQCLTSLKHLSISCCPAITALLDLNSQTMTTLQTLNIEGCDELASLGHFPALPSLKRLAIGNCPQLHRLHTSSSASSSSSSPLRTFEIGGSSPQQMKGWLLQSNLVFPFLQELHIEGCPQLRSFDKELEEALIHLAPTLRALTIACCDNLRSLPTALSRLSSLQTLAINCCNGIRSLPEMGLPSSLRYLRISSCPTLAERCRDQSRPDWPKISHVPEVYVAHHRIT